MLISCQNCAASYQVDASVLGATGRSVRCSACQRVWFAANPGAIAQIAQAHRADLAVISGTSVLEDVSAPAQAVSGADGVTMEALRLADLAVIAPEAEGLASTETPIHGADAPAIPPDAPDPEFVDQPQPPLPIVAGPALAPMHHQGDAAASTDDRVVGEDIETVALRRAKEEAARWRLRWPLAAWPTAVLALIAINAALIGARAEVVRWAPQTASLYAAMGMPVNVRSLKFANVTTQKELQDGASALVVEGMIVSTAARATQVPRLRFGLRNEAGNEIYSWTALPARKMLGAGESLAFRSRLVTPPVEGRNVVVRFVNRRDVIADIP